MYKYIFIGLILFGIIESATAQDRKALSKEITNKMSFMKKGYDKRQIEFRDDSIFGIPFVKVISKKNIEKDSLRHLLVDNGFYDFNFERFDFKIKNLNELNEGLTKSNNPQLFKLLSDSTFNKITYSFQQSNNELIISLILSENYIILDNEKEMHYELFPGAAIHQVIFKGYSKKKEITYCEEDLYFNLIRDNKKLQNDIKLDDNSRFKITTDIHSNISKYIGIKDSQGKMISIIKP